MRPLPRSRRVAAAVLVAGLSLGCAGDDQLDALRAEVEQLREERDTTEDLRAQVEALEAELADLRSLTVGGEDVDDDGADPLGELADELAAITARVDELAATRPTREDVAELADDAAGGAASDVRRSLDEVRAIAERALGEIEILEDVIDVLQRRLDRCESEGC